MSKRKIRSNASPASPPLPRFAVLLAMITVLMVAAPILNILSPRLPDWLVSLSTTVAFFAMLLSAVFAISGSRRSVTIGLALIAPVLLSQLVDVIWHRKESLIVDYVLSIAFMIYVIAMMLQWMFRQQRVDVNMICCSLCVYLLLGVAWAIVFSLLSVVDPLSFSDLPSVVSTGGTIRFGASETVTALYFSFVTLTTLGYGDITPTSAAARMLAVVEAIMGQLYLAVLVARLVGSYIAGKDNRG
ncbi:MAG: potassium channel family protein [Pirellulaceae bacterium]